ncbi:MULTISPECIES: hypothetical protein [unclassified Nocardia]|uniref:hypothetical protein n=1 Tax=unclassified Nocardia TaxID=2637762 RepID=UPI00278BEBF0|nr:MULTISPECIES: hypothetical protein [unclassified Nocardia]
MAIAIVMFLSGIGLGAIAVWTMVSYTAVNPVPTARPKDSRTVQSIITRIERERREVEQPSHAGFPVRCG